MRRSRCRTRSQPMSIRLACADFTFPLLPHDDVLRLLAMLGFAGVDVGLFEQRSHLWPSREYVHPDRSGTQLKAKLADLGLVAADIFLQMDPDFTPWAINHPEAARRATRPLAGGLQGQCHRLRPRARRAARAQLCRLAGRGVCVDRLGALQRVRQSVGDDSLSGLPTQRNRQSLISI